jgi:hypothetical protein
MLCGRSKHVRARWSGTPTRSHRRRRSWPSGTPPLPLATWPKQRMWPRRR